MTTSKISSTIAPHVFNITPSSKTSLQSGISARKSGNVVVLNGVVIVGSNGLAGSNDLVLTIAENARPSANQNLLLYATYNGSAGWYTFTLRTDGGLYTATGSSSFAANSNIMLASVVYIV